ncbi:unnamed protein product [Bursaphelenchus okinawaensis]|uniref:CYtochrome P450 family n=1 Tax=Bursaphelenchus okinawaensis TaxID=465554 RepID=A0A811K235_9BILA|nr:unnamed protein product [Bursaphelenchus okinawaensis]CAG9089194.1 unnamed protein product [Bursaphelenchus okinawaensis]
MFFLILASLVALVLFYNYYWKRRNLPPGPTPLPFAGNAIELANCVHWPDTFLKWHKQFGKVITYWMAEIPIVAVSDPKLIHKVFVKDGDCFADRFSFGVVDQLSRGGEYGILFVDWKVAREHRRFGLKVFRDFGVGKNQMQENILDETQTLLERIDRQRAINDDFDLFPFTDIAVGSIINAILFGYRFTENNKEDEFRRMKSQLQTFIDRITHPVNRLWIATGLMHKLPFLNRYCYALVDIYREIYDDMDKHIVEHRQQLQAEGHTTPRDYVDAYLMEAERLKAKGEDTSGFSDLQLKGMAFDFWIAGQETTSTTMTWGIAFLIHNPDVQKKAHEELDRVIGSDRIINMNDKNDLPYMNALINEVQRRSNLISENVLRVASVDYNLEGYTIKKGQVCIAQVSALMEDPDFFPDPKAFKPERFLDSNGQLKKCDELLPFGVGKRSCFGEALARMELFLFMANLINKYMFLPSKDSEMPILQKWPRGSLPTMKAYKCRVVDRHQI